MPHPKWNTAVRFGGNRRHIIESEACHLMSQILGNKKM
jgi:hypothetical protein